MMMQDLLDAFPQDAKALEIIEMQIHDTLLDSDMQMSIKLVDAVIFLFTDDLQNTLCNATTDDLIILLLSEAFKRIRASFILSLKGYFIDSSALLRSVYELNKAINAIQNGALTAAYYLSDRREPEFLTLPKKKRLEEIKNHTDKVDKIINDYDNAGLSPSIRDSLRIFKSNFNMDVHKAMGSIALNFHEFRAGQDANLFRPFSDLSLFGLCVNNFSLLILMFIRNVLRSPHVNPINRQKLLDVSKLIEDVYSNSEGYTKDILNYILAKFSIG